MVFKWQSVNFAKCNTEDKQKINFLLDKITIAHSATNLTLKITMTELSSLIIFINFVSAFLMLLDITEQCFLRRFDEPKRFHKICYYNSVNKAQYAHEQYEKIFKNLTSKAVFNVINPGVSLVC